jgi:hypothetical protein
MTFARDLASFADSASQNLTFRNKIINGDFGIWQRGTSFTPTNNSYTADRFGVTFGGSGTLSVSQQTFTPGTAPVAGYEGQFFARMNVSSVSTISALGFFQGIEDVRTFAGQTVTVSFWAKADSARTISTAFGQGFGTGGSSFISGIGSTNLSVTTSWTRVTATISIPSVFGKTIGTSSALYFYIFTGQASGLIVDIWGVQVEAGPAPTPFETRPIGTELALCQRYYQALQVPQESLGAQYSTGGGGAFYSVPISFLTTMRTTPSSVTYTNVSAGNYWVIVGATAVSANSLTGQTITANKDSLAIMHVRQAGGAGVTSGNYYVWEAGFSLGVNAEL